MALNPLTPPTFRQRQETEKTAPLEIRVSTPVTTVTNSNATLYTVRAGNFLQMDGLTACNIAGAPITLTVYIVPSGGAAGNGNKIFDAYTLAANSTVELVGERPILVDEASSVIAVTSSATGANFLLWGREING